MENRKNRVLVTYATAAGSTAGVAERIAATLQADGAEVVCRPAGPDVDPSDFDAVVVGSAVHDMGWLPPAVDVMLRAQQADRPVWGFSVGGIQPKGWLTRMLAGRELRRIESSFPRPPREHRLFGGIIDMDHTPLWGRLFFRATGGRAGDHRDWQAIEEWATDVGDGIALAGAAEAPVGPEW